MLLIYLFIIYLFLLKTCVCAGPGVGVGMEAGFKCDSAPGSKLVFCSLSIWEAEAHGRAWRPGQGVSKCSSRGHQAECLLKLPVTVLL